jgi:hypothetical protein
MVNIAELHQLPSLEKLKIIELLWGDLEEDSLQSLSWHETELKKTEADFLAGNIKAVDWQQAKKELRARFA